MRWPRTYVELILRFAQRVTEVGDIPLSEALLEWTPLYLNFDLGRSFDATDPTWQEFLAGYGKAADPAEWTHSFYLAHAREYPPSPYGCFSYHYEPEARAIRFHFGNRDTSGHGPFSSTRRPARLRELATMFAAIREKVPEAQSVRGGSWMYNLPSYCRLFPREYVRSARPAEPELQFMSLWGQFLDHTWELQRDRADAFLRAIAGAATLDALTHSSPMQVMTPGSDIAPFYAFYGVE
jgi:hypothetical protein